MPDFIEKELLVEGIILLAECDISIFEHATNMRTFTKPYHRLLLI